MSYCTAQDFIPRPLTQVPKQRSSCKPVAPQPFDFSCHGTPSEKTPDAYRRQATRDLGMARSHPFSPACSVNIGHNPTQGQKRPANMTPWCFANPPLLRRRSNLPPVPIIPLPGTTPHHLRLDSQWKWYHIIEKTPCCRNHFCQGCCSCPFSGCMRK